MSWWWKAAIAAWVLTNIALCLTGRAKRSESMALAAGLRPRMFLANLPILAVVVVTGSVLLQVPGLDWGWYTLVSGHPGNAAASFLSDDVWMFLPFAVLLALAMPQFVLSEEELFRSGTGGTRSMLVRSTAFGLMHCLVGVPIGAGLALIVGGLWFTRQYRRGGLEHSARYHLAWNYTALVAMSVGVIGLAAS